MPARNDDFARCEVECVRLTADADQHRIDFPADAQVEGQIATDSIIILAVHVEEIPTIPKNLNWGRALHAERIAEQEIGKSVPGVTGAERILAVAAVEVER